MESRLSANTRCSAIAMQTLQAGSDALKAGGMVVGSLFLRDFTSAVTQRCAVESA